MTEKNSFLVEQTLVDTHDDFFLGQWALPNFDSAVAQVEEAAKSFSDHWKTLQISDSVSSFSFLNTAAETTKALCMS